MKALSRIFLAEVLFLGAVGLIPLCAAAKGTGADAADGGRKSAPEQTVAATTLSYRNAQGFEGRDDLIVHKRKGHSVVTLDGVELDDLQTSQISPYLAQVLSISTKPSPSPAFGSCAAGNFTHWTLLEGKKKTEQGCLTDRRYEELQHGFELIKQAIRAPKN